jgi:ribonucleotide reductase beta subunit family protein with ferritin-like domain
MKVAKCIDSSLVYYGKIARTPCKNTLKIFICVYDNRKNAKNIINIIITNHSSEGHNSAVSFEFTVKIIECNKMQSFDMRHPTWE